MPNNNSTKLVNGIVGYEKEINQLLQMRDILSNPEKYKKCGVHIPNGLLLYGPPGVGKTKMAKAIPDNNINIEELCSADCVKQNSGDLIKDAFNRAKSKKPCILLIDEIDKIAGLSDRYHKEDNDKVMKVLLHELDSLKDEDGVLVVATCNDNRSLGKALVRSGRFDRVLEIDLPTVDDRKKILDKYLDNIKLNKSIDVNQIAELTAGYSGAQLECIVNESAIIAFDKDKKVIDFECFRIAINRLNFKSIEDKVDDKMKHEIAVHEAGHAVVALYLKPDSISTVSIIPQGKSKGNMQMVGREKKGYSIDEDDVAIAIGGKVAETVEFGKHSAGCNLDLKTAVDMTDELLISYGAYGYEYLINFEITSSQQLDRVVTKRAEILRNMDNKVKNIIIDHKEVFDRIVSALETKHVLNKDELIALLG